MAFFILSWIGLFFPVFFFWGIFSISPDWEHVDNILIISYIEKHVGWNHVISQWQYNLLFFHQPVQGAIEPYKMSNSIMQGGDIEFEHGYGIMWQYHHGWDYINLLWWMTCCQGEEDVCAFSVVNPMCRPRMGWLETEYLTAWTHQW